MSFKSRFIVEDFKDDLKAISKLAAPVFLANVCNIGTIVSDNMFLGHLGSEAFAAAAISIVYTAATIWIAVGLVFGMDTLVSQSYGAGNYELVGIITQNALLVVTVAAIPVSITWLFSENFVLLLGIEPAIAEKAGTFTLYMIPGLLPYLYYYVMQRYLTNQNIIMPSLIVGAIGFFLNIIFNYVFIFALGFGFVGSPIATSCSRIVLPILMWGYIYTKKLHKPTWFGWSKQMFDKKRLLTYLKFGVSGGLMVLLEVIGFELTTLTASLLVTPVELNAHSIAFNSLLVSFTVPLSISIAVSTRVGQFLGEGKPERAKNSGKTGGMVTVAIMLINAILIFAFRNYFGRLYTNDSRVLEIAPSVLMFSAVVAFFDGVQAFLGGIMRGAGTPHAGTVLNLFGYYVIGGGSYFLLGYLAKWGLYGVWTGLILALVVISVGGVIIVMRIDWKKESELARQRSAKEPELELDSLIVKDEDTEELPVNSKLEEDDQEHSERESLVSHSTTSE